MRGVQHHNVGIFVNGLVNGPTLAVGTHIIDVF
jgi:hypothetical protein